jgi:hypothetical protein
VRGVCFSVFAIAMLAAMPAARAADCPQAEIGSAASAVQDARYTLMALPPNAELQTAIPRDTARAVADLKTRLAAFVLAYMRCQPQNADATGIALDLSRLGWARAPAPDGGDGASPRPSPARPGRELTFDVRALPEGLLGITATFAIPCGSDTLLMVFEHRDGGWAEIMRLGARPYRDVTHAYNAFDYAVSSSDGGWFLVEKHAPASCVSFFAGISYSVLQPGPDAMRARTVFAASDTIFAGGTDFGQLSVGPGYFEIRFHNRNGGEDAARDYVRRFSVDGQGVRPIPADPP